MVTAHPASPKDTFDHVFGSGATSYPWWIQLVVVPAAFGPGDADVPDDWRVEITAEDPDDECKFVIKAVDHALVMETARAIVSRQVRQPVKQTRECRNLLLDTDEADFDAPLADELLQIIVYGKVVFG